MLVYRSRMGNFANLSNEDLPALSARHIIGDCLMKLRIAFFTICLAFAPTALLAGEADVVKVEVRKTGAHTFSFDVTVRHGDTGWKHYANKWDIVTADGKVLGTRVLHHPHENEQPFTRSLGGVRIPADVKSVTVRAYDSVHALGGATKVVNVPH